MDTDKILYTRYTRPNNVAGSIVAGTRLLSPREECKERDHGEECAYHLDR